ncbi:MAG: fibronectin type III domain-containing protein [Lachnospiraceae bacterium]
MKRMRKGLAFFLAFAMMFSMCQTPVFAETAAPAPASEENAAVGHLSAEATTESVQVGDDITIKLSLSQMDVRSFAGGLHFDSEYVEFVSADPASYTLTGTNDETGADVSSDLTIECGQSDVGMYFIGTKDVTYGGAGEFTTVTFKALKEGIAKFNLYESTDGNDAFDSDAYGDFSVEIAAGAEVSDTAFSLVSAEGETIAVSAKEMKAVESVTTTADDPWTYNTTNEAVGTFYSLKGILESKGVDASEAHGLKVVAKDGFTSGFTAEDIENLYVYDMSEVTINGEAAGAAGTYGTALNGGAGNKWAKDIATIAIATDHVWFVKGGSCKHYCSICGVDEPSITLADADGEEATVHDCEIRAAASVTTTADEPWTYNETNEAVGTFYSLKSILESKGVDASEAHGLKVVAKDGFTSGFAAEDIENLYIYDMSEVTVNGETAGAAGTYGTALNGGAGNKWAKDIATAAIVTDHVWFVKGGTCKHYCSICGVDEPSITLADADGEEAIVYDCEIKSAASVTVTADAPWTYNTTNEAVGTFYSLKSILESEGMDVSEAHGLKVVATDGFTSGFAAEDIENLYIYDMSEVTINGETAGKSGTYGTALNGGAGNKWAKDIATVAIAADHVWFVKNGTCKHFCAICGEEEKVIAGNPIQIQWDTTVTPYTATVNAEYACGAPVEVKVEVTSEKAPTCTEDGEIEYTASCTIDGKEYTDTKTAPVPKTGHEYKETVTKATLTKNGKIVKTCIHDGCTYSKTTTIYYPKTIQLSTTTYTYNGSVKNPSVTVIDSKGNTISNNNYTVTKDSGRKNVGTYTYTIKFKGNYSGTKKLSFTIIPAKPAISSLTNTSDGITVKWSKVSSAGGYYILRSKDGGTYSKIKTITGNSTTSYTDTKEIVNGSKYRYKIIAYKTVSGKTYKSKESSVKTIYRLTRPTISSLTNSASKKMTVKWNRNTKATGYQIQYSKSSSFSSGVTTVKVSGNSTVKKTIASLTKGKKYYVRVRAYRTVSGITYYSSWSAKKSVTISK